MKALHIIVIQVSMLFLSLMHPSFSKSQSTEIQGDSLVRRTTMWATFLPGSGQIINKKYWKAPIVWGGLYWCISAVDYNVQEMKHSLNIIYDLESEGFGPGDSAYDVATERVLFYRKWRDLSILGAIGVHALGILDAHVDANLFNFDVSEDLSLGYTFKPDHERLNLIPSVSLKWRIGASVGTSQIVLP